MNFLREALAEAWGDTLEMVPLLFLLFLLLEEVQHRLGGRLGAWLREAGRWGPLAGAGLGIIPQCGFSVLASLLYLRGLITPGTLLAVFLATSDEAVPVMLAQPAKIGYIAPLLMVKFGLGVAGGYLTDFIFRHDGRPALAERNGGLPKLGGHIPGEHAHPVRAATMFYHAARQTVHTYAFVLAASTLLNIGVELVGFSGVSRLLLVGSPSQPVLAALIGLIPNCAASVVLAQLYLEGALSFGAAVAGLGAAAGLGLLVLARHNSPRDTLRLVGFLLAFAVLAGLLLPARPVVW
ncbi:MAG: hypothetical protein PWQ41_197 [Bacillota bacterium]|jgi:hypothetical protein|nr:hypothetical protein [Bacillota bacterium]MDK2855266.1 hypothetical protein [Bacillota bacterium]MDK2924423.1 hypothetical protein [Bacillota bacterium]